MLDLLWWLDGLITRNKKKRGGDLIGRSPELVLFKFSPLQDLIGGVKEFSTTFCRSQSIVGGGTAEVLSVSTIH